MTRCSENKGSIISNFSNLVRKCLFSILSMGPIPDHIAFIMDGNRRFAKKCNLGEGTGHRLGFTALMSMLRYCYELDVKYVTIYAFSIDNFKSSPEEVKSLMEVLREKIYGLLKEESIVNRYGTRVNFIGNLKLLDDPVRLAAEKAIAATSANSKAMLSICIAYTSTNKILNAVQKSFEELWDEHRVLNSCGLPYGSTDNMCVRTMKRKLSLI